MTPSQWHPNNIPWVALLLREATAHARVYIQTICGYRQRGSMPGPTAIMHQEPRRGHQTGRQAIHNSTCQDPRSSAITCDAPGKTAWHEDAWPKPTGLAYHMAKCFFPKISSSFTKTTAAHSSSSEDKPDLLEFYHGPNSTASLFNASRQQAQTYSNFASGSW